MSEFHIYELIWWWWWW